MPYAAPRYDYVRPPELGGAALHRPVVIAGGGLVGLTMALELARRGIRSVLLDDDDTVSTGSRAICFAKRSLEIYDRLGLGRRMLDKGVTWNLGKVYFQDRQIYSFNLLPESGHEFPAFINLQQYYAEQWLVEACRASGLVELRWRNRVTGVENAPERVTLDVETPDGAYRLTTDWLLACDGAHSAVRQALDLPFAGKVFRDHFLIADVLMKADFPVERRFWFDPPFHPNQSVLLHKQPDDVWRIDFQLGANADPEQEKQPANVIPRIRAMLGEDVPFELEWVSVYTFRCRRMQRFVHGRTIFLGDAAHQVSPFGARGGNAGVQDVDNLGWKLASVLRGQADAALIASYDAERIPAADENILHSTRSTDFITPKSEAARAYRDGALALAERFAFARTLINSGRLSRPAILRGSPLNAPDSDGWGHALPLGAPAPDAPVQAGGRADWLLHHLGGDGFTLLGFGPDSIPAGTADALARERFPVRIVRIGGHLADPEGLAANRFGAPPGACVLLRPDQHVAAQFIRFDPHRLRAALRHVLSGGQTMRVAETA